MATRCRPSSFADTMSPALELDHLVVGASTLEEGMAWIADRFGVTIGPGGRHPRMGTHNVVMQVGGGAYLEVIAVDPDAGPPEQPRWFDLDNPWVAAELARGPRLLTWVARVPAPGRIADVDGAAGIGEPLAMSRDRLRWLITVPADGRLPCGGVLPTLIEWQCEPPAASMADVGCVLRGITLHHRAASWLRGRLEALGAGALVEVEYADAACGRIEATFDSPAGRVVL